MKFLYSFCFILNLTLLTLFVNSFPLIQVEILLPNGFRIAIPHQDGMSHAEIHVSINKPIALNAPGDISGKITEPFNGRWVLENTNTSVYYKSTINFWIRISFGTQEVIEKVGRTTISQPYIELSDEPEVNTKNITLLPSGCEQSVTTVRGKPVCKGQLIFEDDFDTINWTKWSREVRIPLDDADFVSFQRRAENFYVRSGYLYIVPSLLSDVPGFDQKSILNGKLDLGEFCTGIIDPTEECSREARLSQILPPIVSARARTRHYFSFRYGRVEVRAKVPIGDWLFPLILLEPLENYYGSSGYASGQLRIASIRGNEHLEDIYGADISGKQVSGGAVLATGESFRQNWLQSSLEGSHLGNDFHVYALTWTENSIILEIDDIRYAVIQGGFARLLRESKSYAKHWENGHYMAPFDRELFLTLGVSVGGHSDFPEECSTGDGGEEKSWNNGDPKAILKFWNNRRSWLKTWKGEQTGLKVDYIKVYAL